MSEQGKQRKGGGGKLTRSETVTIRLDPKLRYLAELAARKQRRTVSSFIEWAVEESLARVMLYVGTGYNGNDDVSVQDEAGLLWDVDEAERFVRLAVAYPELLTIEEQEKWKMLLDSGLLDRAKRRTTGGQLRWDLPCLEDNVFKSLRDIWPDVLTAYDAGARARQQWVKETRAILGDTEPAPKPSSSFDDSSDDIPF
ncbi:MAG: hypothetical protein LBO79_10770 [Zoogloeaceae bacterium]|jgi:predicted transcriptional regulator|nr:hypothetical protein [Zoogloeaceae bacterium]